MLVVVSKILLWLPRGGQVQQLGPSSHATAGLTVGRFSRRLRSTPRSSSHQAAEGTTCGPSNFYGVRPSYSFRCEALMGSSLASVHRLSVLVMMTCTVGVKRPNQWSTITQGHVWGGPRTKMCVPLRENSLCTGTPLQQHSAAGTGTADGPTKKRRRRVAPASAWPCAGWLARAMMELLQVSGPSGCVRLTQP